MVWGLQQQLDQQGQNRAGGCWLALQQQRKCLHDPATAAVAAAVAAAGGAQAHTAAVSSVVAAWLQG